MNICFPSYVYIEQEQTLIFSWLTLFACLAKTEPLAAAEALSPWVDLWHWEELKSLQGYEMGRERQAAAMRQLSCPEKG